MFGNNEKVLKTDDNALVPLSAAYSCVPALMEAMVPYEAPWDFGNEETLFGPVEVAEKTEVLKTDEPSEVFKTDEPSEVFKTDEPSEVLKTDEPSEVLKTDEPSEVLKTDEQLPVKKSKKSTMEQVWPTLN